MNKPTKAALAAGGAAVLLVGGAGTLAFWTAQDSVDGGSITAGSLTLTANDDCTPWEYAADHASAGTPVTAFVPGDTVTSTCTFTIGGSGDNLEATLAVPEAVDITPDDADSSFAATVTPIYQLDGVALPSAPVITEENDGETLSVTFDVEIPFGDADTVNTNDTQAITATLDTLTVTLAQTNPNP